MIAHGLRCTLKGIFINCNYNITLTIQCLSLEPLITSSSLYNLHRLKGETLLEVVLRVLNKRLNNRTVYVTHITTTALGVYQQLYPTLQPELPTEVRNIVT